jgi:hypothetical protein
MKYAITLLLWTGPLLAQGTEVITGQVLLNDRPPGSRGSTVQMELQVGDRPGEPMKTMVSSEGEYRFVNLKVGLFVVVARAPGYQTAKTEVETLGGNQTRGNTRLVLVPEQSLPEGKQTDSVVSQNKLRAPKKAVKHVEDAEKALEVGDLEKAAKALDRALALYPEYGRAIFQQGRLLEKQNKPDEAILKYELALHNDSGWYQRIQLLDITTGAEFSKPKTAHAVLAGWLDSSERQRCFGCHVTHQADAVPEEIQQANAGVQCERCHGPGRRHVEAATQGKTPLSETIVNPGKLKASDQLNYCGQCHRAPSENLGQVMTDKSTIRFPAQRLVLSRCYDESNGKLKCTTCHDPHGNLPQSMSAYDPKCLSCHAGRAAMGSPCPISKKDCVTCHMPVEPLMKHSEFADHWIRKIRGPLGRN